MFGLIRSIDIWVQLCVTGGFRGVPITFHSLQYKIIFPKTMLQNYNYVSAESCFELFLDLI